MRLYTADQEAFRSWAVPVAEKLQKRLEGRQESCARSRGRKIEADTVVVHVCGFAAELETAIRPFTEESVRIPYREDLAGAKALKKEIPFKKRFLLATLKIFTPIYRSQI